VKSKPVFETIKIILVHSFTVEPLPHLLVYLFAQVFVHDLVKF